jgi:hypothetical protein
VDASHIPSASTTTHVRLDDEFTAAQRLVIEMEVYDRSATGAKMAKLARAATEAWAPPRGDPARRRSHHRRA